MAKMKEAAAREYQGPKPERDKLLAKHDKWASKEKDAASEAGERRQEIGALAEGMNLENKALSQFRAGLKIKNEGKQRDWLRSMEALLPIARDRIMGNQPDMLQDEVPGVGREPEPEETAAPTGTKMEETGDADLDAETKAFTDQMSGDDDGVVPFYSGEVASK